MNNHYLLLCIGYVLILKWIRFITTFELQPKNNNTKYNRIHKQ